MFLQYELLRVEKLPLYVKFWPAKLWLISARAVPWQVEVYSSHGCEPFWSNSWTLYLWIICIRVDWVHLEWLSASKQKKLGTLNSLYRCPDVPNLCIHDQIQHRWAKYQCQVVQPRSDVSSRFHCPGKDTWQATLNFFRLEFGKQWHLRVQKSSYKANLRYSLAKIGYSPWNDRNRRFEILFL